MTPLEPAARPPIRGTKTITVHLDGDAYRMVQPVDVPAGHYLGFMPSPPRLIILSQERYDAVMSGAKLAEAEIYDLELETEPAPNPLIYQPAPTSADRVRPGEEVF